MSFIKKKKLLSECQRKDDTMRLGYKDIPVLLFQTKHRRQPVWSFKHRNRLYMLILSTLLWAAAAHNKIFHITICIQ